jgi:hypothetical protein
MLNSLNPLLYQAVETNPRHTFAANHEKEAIAAVGRIDKPVVAAGVISPQRSSGIGNYLARAGCSP